MLLTLGAVIVGTPVWSPPGDGSRVGEPTTDATDLRQTTIGRRNHFLKTAHGPARVDSSPWIASPMVVILNWTLIQRLASAAATCRAIGSVIVQGSRSSTSFRRLGTASRSSG